MGSCRLPKKMGSRLIGWPKEASGRGERQWYTVHLLSQKWGAMITLVLWHGSLATHSQVIYTTGLRIDYTFRIGLQAQEIWLGSPDCFPWERQGLGMRLFKGFKAKFLCTNSKFRSDFHVKHANKRNKYHRWWFSKCMYVPVTANSMEIST